MVEFNPDGSIKLPSQQAKKQAEEDKKMTSQRFISIRKDMVYSRAPKKCRLTLKLSQMITSNEAISSVYRGFIERADTPMKLELLNEREATVEIGTDFKRCSDCQALVARFREHFDGNVLLDKGTCPRKDRAGEGSEFTYEDYFE